MYEPLIRENETGVDTDCMTIPSSSPAAHLHARHHHASTVVGTRQRRSTRLLDRDAAFFQSRGLWRIAHVSRDSARHQTSQGGSWRRRRKRFWKNDWFYVLAYQKTIVLVGILFCAYTAIVFVFATVYLSVSLIGQEEQTNADGSVTAVPFCDLEINNFMEALYFSLSTVTTIGYGVSDYYFSGCWTPLLLVLAQSCTAITFDAVAVGILFQRISRGRKRGKTVLFSDKAIIRCVRGMHYFMFRMAELRHHHLLEATVRVYCVRHERHAIVDQSKVIDSEDQHVEPPFHAPTPIETLHYISRPMQLLHQDAGSHILMSLPQVITHRIDDASPLSPVAPFWFDRDGTMHQRESISTQDLDAFLRDREAEIIVLLEGTDELTGATIQARHSYSVDDLAWNKAFAPCTFPAIGDGDASSDSDSDDGYNANWFRRSRRVASCEVDFSRFHDIVVAPSDCANCPYVSE